MHRDCRSRVVTCGRFAGKISVNFYDQPIEQLAGPRNHESAFLHTLRDFS